MLMTVSQVAEYLRVSNGCVYSMISKHLLAHSRVGVGSGRIRVLLKDVESYIESRRVNELKTPNKPQPRPMLKHLKITTSSRKPPGFG